jgi:hypothetical protein
MDNFVAMLKQQMCKPWVNGILCNCSYENQMCQLVKYAKNAKRIKSLGKMEFFFVFFWEANAPYRVLWKHGIKTQRIGKWVASIIFLLLILSLQIYRSIWQQLVMWSWNYPWYNQIVQLITTGACRKVKVEFYNLCFIFHYSTIDIIGDKYQTLEKGDEVKWSEIELWIGNHMMTWTC